MKILHLIQKKQLRGAEVFTSQLSNHICEQGHEAVIVSLFKGNANLPFDGKIIELKASASKKYWDIQGWKKLAQIIKEEKPDIIQANAGDTLKYAIFSRLLFRWRQPVIFRNASTISLYIKSFFVKALYRFLFSQTDKILSVSNNSANDFENLYPECRSKIKVIPIGIEKHKAVEQKTFQNPFSKFKTGGPVLLHVGGFTFEKNHKGLIEIFKRVLRRFPDATLHLVGEGPLKKEVENLVIGGQLTQKVFFHGYQNEPLQWIQHADVLLLPSIIEGLPGVILEAFYCQTPVVANDTGGIKEIVLTNKTGFLINKNDSNAFAEAVAAALLNKEKTREMVANAFELVNTYYLNTKIAKGFLDVYEQLSPAVKNKQIKIPVTTI